MTPLDLRTQLENELSWRYEEIVFFQNILYGLNSDNQNQYRRSLVLIVYAHFEGFCKFALCGYLAAVNQERVSCFRAVPEIAAASMHDIFKALKDPQSKSDLFRRSAPDDRKLHAYARDVEFVEKAKSVMRSIIEIPESAVDTESNLKPVVLRKNLFRLGLDVDGLSEHEGTIDKLLGVRNGVAHGAIRGGVQEKDYSEFRESAFAVMNAILQAVHKSFSDKKYLRAGAVAA